jgi:hypothetical protein
LLLTKASSTPFQTATNASSAVPSKDSEAKKGMSNHVAHGFVTDGMAAKEDYNDKRLSKGSTVDGRRSTVNAKQLPCRRKRCRSATHGETALVLMEAGS